MNSQFPDLMHMLVNLGRVIPTFIMLGQAVVGLIGVWLTGKGVIELFGASNDNMSKHMSSHNGYNTTAGIVAILIGGVLLSLSTLEFVGVLSRSITGDYVSARMTADVLSYTQGGSNSAKEKALAATLALLALMQAVGFVAITKSVLTFNAYFKQKTSEPFGKAVAWGIGGALAWNFKWFADVLNNTFGFNFIGLFSSIA